MRSWLQSPLLALPRARPRRSPLPAQALHAPLPAALDPIVAPALDAMTAQPGGLTSQIVAARGVDASAALSEKHAELEAANARVEETRRKFFPILAVAAATTAFRRSRPAWGRRPGSVRSTGAD